LKIKIYSADGAISWMLKTILLILDLDMGMAMN